MTQAIGVFKGSGIVAACAVLLAAASLAYSNADAAEKVKAATSTDKPTSTASVPNDPIKDDTAEKPKAPPGKDSLPDDHDIADTIVIEAEPEKTAFDYCQELNRRLSSVRRSDCVNGKLESSELKSVEGRPILTREFPPVEGREPVGRVLVVGGIHGDELTSVSIVFDWIRKLNKYHSGLFHWHVAPAMNPDGVLSRPASRMNSNGVDLNRNFPTPDWHAKSRHYWEVRTRRNPRRYPGKNPLSEPESGWLYKEIKSFQPDVIVAVHAPFGIVDFDGPPEPPRRLGHLYLNLLGTYPGSLGNYAGVQQGIPVITLELPSAGSMPTAHQSNRIWVDLVRWLRRNIPRTREVRRKGSEVSEQQDAPKADVKASTAKRTDSAS